MEAVGGMNIKQPSDKPGLNVGDALQYELYRSSFLKSAVFLSLTVCFIQKFILITLQKRKTTLTFGF